MTETCIPNGAVLMSRNIFQSSIWFKEPLYIKCFLWIIGKANHKDRVSNGRLYKRGELCTTYDEIINANYYIYNRKVIYPTIKQVRNILAWLESEGMIQVNPIKSGLGRTGADTRAHTGAYVGIKIIVVNYDTYQAIENYRGTHQDSNIFEQGQNNKNANKNVKDYPAEISILRARYSDQPLIDRCLQAIASTRKSGKVADSVIYRLFEFWEKCPTSQVESGIQVYLDKNYAAHGKDEKYLTGIIRRQADRSGHLQPSIESTGSALLDAYHANAN